MLMIRAVAGDVQKQVDVTANATAWGGCGTTEVALFVGTSISGNLRFQVPRNVRKIAQMVARSKYDARPGTPSTATITVGTEANDDTVTIDGTALTVKAAVTDPTTQILHGATPAATAINLITAIQSNATIRQKITAAINGSTAEQVDLSSRFADVGQDALTLAESGDTFTISGATFANGASFVNVYSLTAKQVPEQYELNKRAIATGVTQTMYGLIIGDTAWYRVSRNGGLLTLVEHLCAYYKRAYLNKA